MLAVLNFAHTDRDLALNLLRWMGELGGCKGHDLLLACNRMAADAMMHAELEEEARKHFDAVSVFTPGDEDERPWPCGPNHAWRAMVFHVEYVVRRPFLWLEPDVTPLKPGWMDAISGTYDAALKTGKAFLGCDVNVPGSKRHMSGIAVYPPHVIGACKRRYMNMLNAYDDPKRCEAWDMFFADEFLPHVAFTPLIQHLQHWPGYPDAPTFTESGPELHPQAVLFHRCKDESLIARLRRERFGAVASVPVQAGNMEIVTPSLKPLRRPARKPSKRTPEEQAVINARMEKARAARKAVAA